MMDEICTGIVYALDVNGDLVQAVSWTNSDGLVWTTVEPAAEAVADPAPNATPDLEGLS